jgi:Protein of unknown function (DUF4089)
MKRKVTRKQIARTARKPACPPRLKASGAAQNRREHRIATKVKQVDIVDSLVSANAQALKLPIEKSWQGGIKFNLQLILRMAALVDEFPLPDDAEPGPVFHA